MAITAVLWDADGVLQRARPGWRQTLIDIGGADFPDAVIEVEEQGPMIGRGSFRTALETLLRDRGIDVDPERILALWDRVDSVPAALQLVRRVRAQGVRCHLATNQHDRRTALMREVMRYGDHLDRQFYSCELGVAKPDPEFFLAILRALALRPDEVLFIDDLPANVAAARSVGLSAERHDPANGADGIEAILTAHGLLAPVSTR